jgi:protein-tyrosine-phosphatase/DNA-binding transcriptional ArsR family regulator
MLRAVTAHDILQTKLVQIMLEEIMDAVHSLEGPLNSAGRLVGADFLKVLAHDIRWRALIALARSDHRVQELVEIIGQPLNLVSYHLRRLRDARLVTERRSSADGRDLYYSVDLDRLCEMYSLAGQALHPTLGVASAAAVRDHKGSMSRAGHGQGHEHGQRRGQEEARNAVPVRVLFLCTHNSARSQMAEAIMRTLGGNKVEVYSAGSHPSHVHPLAMRVLQGMSIDASGHRSKHMDEFKDEHFDYIITVCDRVREVCPLFPGDPEHKHWSIPDPAAIESAEDEQLKAFTQTAQDISNRVRYLLPLIQRETTWIGKA